MSKLKDLQSILERGRNSSPPSSEKPVWRGPEIDGITASLLSKFLTCRERFRILVVGGWKPVDQFSHRLEFGSMWHACEEGLANGKGWVEVLTRHVQELSKRWGEKRQEIDRWTQACMVEFPIYMKHWAKHPDVKDRKPLLAEQVFNVPYQLPSGRKARLRGKWDSADVVNGRTWLQENKTKGEIDEPAIRRQLSFDLQTMLYVSALAETDWGRGVPFGGIRYNVIRRPFSGGKGDIVGHPRAATQGAKCPKCKGAGCLKCKGAGRIGAKPAETTNAFYGRLTELIEAAPKEWFARWNVPITMHDVARFKRQFLNPCLEFLSCWWNQMDGGSRLHDVEIMVKNCHWRHPYGVFNPIDNGQWGEYDNYLESGSTAGLQRVTDLFPELAA
jgi:hypothetical protein